MDTAVSRFSNPRDLSEEGADPLSGLDVGGIESQAREGLRQM